MATCYSDIEQSYVTGINTISKCRWQNAQSNVTDYKFLGVFIQLYRVSGTVGQCLVGPFERRGTVRDIRVNLYCYN